MKLDWRYAYRIDRGHPAPLPELRAERVLIAEELVTTYGWTQERAAEAVEIAPRALLGVAA